MRRDPRIPRSRRINPPIARSRTTQSNVAREMESITRPSSTSEKPRFHFCHLAQDCSGFARASKPHAVSATLTPSHNLLPGSNLEKSMRPIATSHNSSAPSNRKTNSISSWVRRAGESMQPQSSGNAFDADLHGDRNARAIHSVARGLGNLVGDVLAFHDFAKDRVAIIEVRRGRYRDKELAAVGARPGVSHRKFSGF